MGAVMDWHDISTAPRDGTEFLAYDVHAMKMDVCRWDERWGAGPVQADGEWGPGEDQFGFELRNIKYWMPLPTPPSSSKQTS